MPKETLESRGDPRDNGYVNQGQHWCWAEGSSDLLMTSRPRPKSTPGASEKFLVEMEKVVPWQPAVCGGPPAHAGADITAISDRMSKRCVAAGVHCQQMGSRSLERPNRPCSEALNLKQS
jgi:hypothetical protein